MSTPNQDERERELAWAALDSVRDHPKVAQWLNDADVRTATLPRRIDTGIGRWAVAASVALVAIALGAGLATYLHWAPTYYETAVGEQRDVMLDDGSRVTLNTNTAVSVRYSDEGRFIQLERGEALFAVRSDPNRPFDVSAGGTLTRALGTEFNVDLRKSGVTVSVLEGAVRVTPVVPWPDSARRAEPSNNAVPAALAPITALGKGQALEFRNEDRQVREEKADLKRIEAWRTRRLEFSDTPLADAVEEFNRYSAMQVVVGTPELASVRVSGVFRIGDAEGFLFSLREALNVETHESTGEVVLMRGGS